MKTKMITALLNVAIGVSLHAGLRSSSDFSITTETLNAGGRRAISTNYTNDGSVGEVAGISTVAAPAETAKSGYLGQIYDITGLTLTAVSLNVNESTTDQLAAWQTLDDATFLAVPAASVAWSVQSGPLTGISASGLATAGIVFQDTAAAAQGIYLGNTGTLGLTVKNVNFDDFGSYGGDGLDDAWQNEYFGLNNPQAAPGADPDGDGENNAFEFTAGLGPTDPASRFTLTLAPVAGQPGQKAIVFTPLISGRTFSVEYRSALTTGMWQTLSGTGQSDNGATRRVTDTNSDPTCFYRV